MTMTYLQLISQLSEDTKYTKREIRAILRQMTKIVTDALVGGQKVHLMGIGSLSSAPDHIYCVRNYKTGERYWTKPRRRIKFKPCTPIRNKVRQSIALFQEPDTTEQYLPKEEHRNGKIRRGD